MKYTKYITTARNDGGEETLIRREEKTVTVERSDLERTVTRITYYVLDIIEGLLLIRFALKSLYAGPSSFVQFIYRATNPLVQPFQGAFPSQGPFIEWASLLAMAVYLLIAVAFLRLLRIAFRA